MVQYLLRRDRRKALSLPLNSTESLRPPSSKDNYSPDQKAVSDLESPSDSGSGKSSPVPAAGHVLEDGPRGGRDAAVLRV